MDDDSFDNIYLVDRREVPLGDARNNFKLTNFREVYGRNVVIFVVILCD